MSPALYRRISTETALRPGLHPTKPADSNLNPRLQANSVSKLTDTKFKTASSISSAPAGLIVVVCPLLLSLHAYVNRKEHVHAATSQPEPEDGLADEEPIGSVRIWPFCLGRSTQSAPPAQHQAPRSKEGDSPARLTLEKPCKRGL
ncbi:hypothetical protein AMELA_G00048840 [Ameiurus melas]|uniref:Uncharacterized protein n=1 Tax=Ameiurus melas TaxID=219545 RepID=A0A7J6B518_AMEME|nr:hypothetical protein AMELA_G00048840 [Ameiurus melas]